MRAWILGEEMQSSGGNRAKNRQRSLGTPHSFWRRIKGFLEVTFDC
jgi:hypothetical protein